PTSPAPPAPSRSCWPGSIISCRSASAASSPFAGTSPTVRPASRPSTCRTPMPWAVSCAASNRTMSPAWPPAGSGSGTGPVQPPAGALVSLLRRVESDNVACLAAGRLGIGVAAYPSGHPESTGPEEDLDVLAAKQRNGADFAITQLFFDPTAYSRLRRRAEHAGITIPIIPGILPITDARRLHTMSRLSGLPVPDHLLARFDGVSDPASARRIGLDITAEHTAAILDQDADGLHFYTFNDQNTTEDLLTALDDRGVS